MAARQEWVDNLRVVLIAGVIVVHTATGYVTDFAGWYYDDEVSPSDVGSMLIAGPALLGGIFGLGPLFLVAGWFSAASLARRGPGGFAGSRVVRLGIPLVFFVVVVNPLADLVGNLWQEDESFLGYLAETEFSVMWFVAALLACSLGYALLRAVAPAPPSRPPPGRRALVVAAATIVVGSLLVWQLTTPLDTHLMNVRVAAWTQGAVLFALGVLAAESGSTGEIARAHERRLGLVTAVGLLAALALLAVEALRDREEDPLRGLGWASVTFGVLYGVVSVAFTLWCVAWVRRRWPTHGVLLAKAGRGSYATYVTHPLVLVSVMLAFRPLPLAAELKFVAVAAVAVPLCFAVGYLLTRVPGVSRVI